MGQSVPETQDGESRQRYAGQHQVRAVLTHPWVVLIDVGSHDGVPEHVNEAHHEEHDGGIAGVQSEDVGVVEQQPYADGLVDEVLCQVTGTEADALEPVQFVEALLLGFLCFYIFHYLFCLLV